MARHIMAFLHAPLCNLRDLFNCLSDGVEGELEVELGEEAEEAPEPCTAAVFVLRFDVVVALVNSRWAAGIFDQVGFGLAVASEDGAFGAL